MTFQNTKSVLKSYQFFSLKGMRSLNHKHHDTCKGFREVNHAFHNPDRHIARSLAPASGHDRHNKLSSKNLLTVLLFLC